MTPSDLLQSPTMMGAALAGAGALFWVVFVLPSFIFPEETDRRDPPSPRYSIPPRPLVRPAPPAPVAFVSAPAPVPVATQPLPPSVRPAPFLPPPIPVPPPPAAPRAPDPALEVRVAEARREREDWERRERRVREESLAALRARADAEAAFRLKSARRLEGRLARWRRGWESRLTVQQESLRKESAALLSQRQALEARRADIASRGRASLESLEAQRRELADRRRAVEAESAARAAEARRLASAAQDDAARAARLENELAALRLSGEKERLAAQEERLAQRRSLWAERDGFRARLTALTAESSDRQARETAEVDALRAAAAREAEKFHQEIAGLQAQWEKERAEQAAAQAAFEARSGLEASEAQKKAAEAAAHASAAQRERDSLLAVLRQDQEWRDGEKRKIREWAESRLTAMRELLSGAEVKARRAMEELRVRREQVAAYAAADKESLAREKESLEASRVQDGENKAAAAERARLAHEARLRDFAVQEESLRQTIAALEAEVGTLRVRTETERLASRERLAHRKARHDAAFARARQKVEAEIVNWQKKLVEERRAVADVESRLAVRRRRYDALRDRRKKAVETLMLRAESAWTEALEAQSRVESVWRGRLADLSHRAQGWETARNKWAAAPERVLETESLSAKNMEDAREAETLGLLARAEEQWEAFEDEARRHREALSQSLRKLSAAEGTLTVQETDTNGVLREVEGQVARLESLKNFFRALRLPENTIQPSN